MKWHKQNCMCDDSGSCIYHTGKNQNAEYRISNLELKHLREALIYNHSKLYDSLLKKFKRKIRLKIPIQEL